MRPFSCNLLILVFTVFMLNTAAAQSMANHRMMMHEQSDASQSMPHMERKRSHVMADNDCCEQDCQCDMSLCHFSLFVFSFFDQAIAPISTELVAIRNSPPLMAHRGPPFKPPIYSV